jgi:hypothetical protein
MTDLAQRSLPAEGPRFSIAGTLSMSFGVLARNFWPMAFISIAITAIQSAIDFMLSGDATGSESSGSSIIGIFTYALITAPVTYATFQDLRGTRVTAGQMLSRGFSRVGRVIGASLVVGLAILVPVAIAVVIAMVAYKLGFVIATAAGLAVLCIVVVWFVLVPVQVMESGSFSAGFGRAADLSRGHRWGILGLLLVYGALIAAFVFALGLILAFAADSAILVAVLFIPLGAFYSAMGAILPAVAYYLLRAEKEGVGIDEIVRVFE